MKQVKVTELENKDYNKLISILDYELTVRNALKDISLVGCKRILIDTIAKNDSKKFRFVAIEVGTDGVANMDDAKYVELDEETLQLANNAIN